MNCPKDICCEPEGRRAYALGLAFYGRPPRTIKEDWGRWGIRGEVQGLGDICFGRMDLK